MPEALQAHVRGPPSLPLFEVHRRDRRTGDFACHSNENLVLPPPMLMSFKKPSQQPYEETQPKTTFRVDVGGAS